MRISHHIKQLPKKFAPLLLTATACLFLNQCAQENTETTPISILEFEDAINHWQSKRGSDYPRHDPKEITLIADNMLIMQRDHGGWKQNQDPLRILDAESTNQYLAEKSDPFASFDNRNIYTQIRYLMSAYEQVNDERYKEAALKGLDYLLSQQIASCGGWPHSNPSSNSYHGHITIADEVFSGPMLLLREISEAQPPFQNLDNATKQRALEARKAGDSCLLSLQIKQNGKRLGWAGQYDPVTLAPAQGRSFELPAMVTQETVDILRYLMTIKEPDTDVIQSIQGGIEWLKQSAIPDTKIETIQLETPIEYKYHTANFDRVLVKGDNAGTLWARFYDLSDNTIVLANRDSVRVAKYEDIHHERRTGYSWYGVWPAELLEKEYPAWSCRVLNQSTNDEAC